jgi:hypothetical protein
MKKSLLHYIILLTAVVSLQACLSDKVKTSDAINTQHYSDKVLKAADISNDGTYSLISDNNQVCLWNNHSNKKSLSMFNWTRSTVY